MECSTEAAVRLMVFNRLCDPEIKLGLLRWKEGVVVPGLDTAGMTSNTSQPPVSHSTFQRLPSSVAQSWYCCPQ